MSCQKPDNALLLCNIDQSKIKNLLIDVIYTDLLLNQFTIFDDFKRLIREIGIDNLYNILIIGDNISTNLLRKKLPQNESLYIVNAQSLYDQFVGNITRSDGKKKLLKRQNTNAFQFNEIYTFKNKETPIIVLFVNVFKNFYIERLIKDNPKSRLKHIYVILNSLLEFPFMYTLETPFKMLLCNDISNKSENCNYINANYSNQVVFSNSNFEQYINSNTLINTVPTNIDPQKKYILNLFGEKLNNIQLYRIFKIFYYTYCFNGAKWSIYPNNKDNDTLYIFKRHFNEELLILSKWWPNDETLSVALEKLKHWCPEIFGDINDWFFHCDVQKIFSNAPAEIQLPHVTSRPMFAGGQIWQAPTMASMCLSMIGMGSTNVLHMDILKDNHSKIDLVGYYKHLFDIEYETSF